MERHLASLQRLSLELFGLTVAMGIVVVIAAHHVFDGFSTAASQTALVFCLSALFLTTIPLQLYVLVRLAKLKSENSSLFDRATRDGLTRVLNRTTFKSLAEAEISSMQRRRGDDIQYTMLIVDADHFKRINDRLGHATGDQALVAIASTLRHLVRKDDLVGRIGGEEFAILLKGAGYEEARVVAERLRAGINQLTVGPRTQPVQLSVSLGGLTFGHALPYDTVYRAADANLYRAKNQGRNRVDITSVVRLLRSEADNRGATTALMRKTL